MFFTTSIKVPITQLICLLKNYNVGEMKTDIKLNLLDDSIIVNTFEKVIRFEIIKKIMSKDVTWPQADIAPKGTMLTISI